LIPEFPWPGPKNKVGKASLFFEYAIAGIDLVFYPSTLEGPSADEIKYFYPSFEF